MSLSGRRPTGRAKSFGRALLDGLDVLGTAMADGPKLTRIREIDEEVRNLLQERDHLIAGLTQSYEGYEVSDNYDPSWKKPEADEDTPIMNQYFGKPQGPGRLTECKGRRTSSTYHDAHPGCPYVDKIHNAHEFTLRD